MKGISAPNLSTRPSERCVKKVMYYFSDFMQCEPEFEYTDTVLISSGINDLWKLTNVVLIYKKGDKCDVSNYRPISLTSLVVKIMEICIRDELYERCRHLIHEKQHGFLPGKSCATQMIPFMNDLTQSLNSRNDVDVIYFDFAKAYDSVNHDIILEKLKQIYNIDGLMLNFIKDYLKDRYQKVVNGGEYSNVLPVNSGVPPGFYSWVTFICLIYQ